MTGSEVGRLLACPTSAVLAREPERSTGWSEEGQQRHRDAEVAAQLGDMESLPPRVARAIAGADVLTELVIVYDVATDTARPLPGIRDRAYPLDLSPFEIPMTLDLVAFSDRDGRRRAVVIDHKLFADQGALREHGQLMTQALAVARAYQLREVDVAISYLGTSWVDGPETVDALDLDEHADRLRDLQLHVVAARRSPAEHLHPGPHCRHCPALLSGGGEGQPCPAHASKIGLIARGTMAAEVERSIPFHDDDAARSGLSLLGQIKLLSARLEESLRARAKERPIPLADGKVWGPTQKLGNEQLDGAAVYLVARELYGAEQATSFVEMKATKKGVDKAIGAIVPRGRKTAAAEALIKDVRRRGGAHRRAKTEYEIHTPPALALAAASEEVANG